MQHQKEAASRSRKVRQACGTLPQPPEPPNRPWDFIGLWPLCSYTQLVRKDSIFRVRMASSEVAALKRVAKEKGQAASEYARRLIAEQVRRDEAARRVREALRGASEGKLSNQEAMNLAGEAKHASRLR